MAGLRLLLVLTVLLGAAYPLAIWGVTRLPGLHDDAEGSQVSVNGQVVGSALIGIDPVDPNAAADPTNDRYFHTRPSASSQNPLGPGDATNTGGSNYGDHSQDLLKQIRQRRDQIAKREGIPPEKVPQDAVTASASGVDPDISPEYAELQVPRVARVYHLSEDKVRQLVAQFTHGGMIQDSAVNVTELNAALASAK